MRELTGLRVKIYLKNNFFFKGKVLKQYDGFLEILDDKIQEIKIISIDQISEVNILRDDCDD